MTKLSWKWFVLVGTVFIFLFYMAITGESYLSMRHISLGEPDPYYFIIMGFGLVFTGWWMFVCMAQNISTEIATEVGGFAVSTVDPIAKIDPLDYYDMSDEARFELKRKIRDSYKYKYYMSEKDILDICGDNEWGRGGPEIAKYILEYQKTIDGLKPVGLYPDGGIKLLGMHGFRWWIGGTSLLAVPPEYIIPHGDGGVCVASVQNYMDIEQLQKMPKWFQRGVVHAFSQFQPGKHIVAFGNRPHPKAVRAMVERNKDAPDEELLTRPKYVWSLPLQVSDVSPEARKIYLEKIGTALRDEATENKDKLDTWEKRNLRKLQGVPEPKEEENDAPD